MIDFFMYMKSGFGLSRSFELAFDTTILDVLFNLLLIAVATAMLIYVGNAIIEGLEYEHNKRAQYTRNLEKTLAKCMSPGDNVIHLEDGSLLLCGATNAGKHGRI